jgi:hypothetical protein
MSSCGACTLCCTLVPVGATGKRSFTRCEYQRDPPAQAIGCAIHATRPASCAAWACQFLREDWPAEFRPDRTGVVFDTVPGLERQMTRAETSFWDLTGSILGRMVDALGEQMAISLWASRLTRELRRRHGLQATQDVLRQMAETMPTVSLYDDDPKASPS